MKRVLVTALLAASMTLAISAAVFAGTWQEDAQGTWYINDDGSYPANEWVWLDRYDNGVEAMYYFDSNGYLLLNSRTPDGRWTNENGEWVMEEGVWYRPVEGVTEKAIEAGYANAGYAGLYYETGYVKDDGSIFYYPLAKNMLTQVQLIINDDDTITLWHNDAIYSWWKTYKKITDNIYQSIDDVTRDLTLMPDGTVRYAEGISINILEKTDDPIHSEFDYLD